MDDVRTDRTRVTRAGALLVASLLAGACASTAQEPVGAGTEAAPAGTAQSEPVATNDPTDAATGTTEDAPDVTPSAGTGTIAGKFDVGGHSLYLRCSGSGSPTVLYLHGAIETRGISPHSNGRHTEQRLGDTNRVCVYDRRNLGASDTVDAEQRPEDAIEDLRALLEAAEVDPPYVLLGASFGGLLGYLYLNTYPEDVVGMVQLDSMFPDELEYEHLFPEEERYEAFSEQDACCTLERIDHFAVMSAAAEHIGEEPAVPLTYFYSLQEPREYGVPEYDDAIEDVMRAYVDRFSPGTFVPVDAPHFMEPAIPDEVADALREVIAAAGG